VLCCSFSFLISFGHVGQYAAGRPWHSATLHCQVLLNPATSHALTLAVIFAGQIDLRIKRQMTKYLQDKYLGLFFCIGFSIYLNYKFFTKEKIESDKDLVEIQGRLSDYSFKDGTGRKRMGHEYYILLDNYSNQFQIKADYLNDFKGVDFITTVNRGDKVVFTIPKSEQEKLNSTDNVFVTSIKVKRKSYLDKNKVIETEKSYTVLYGALGFLVLGFIIFKIKRQ